MARRSSATTLETLVSARRAVSHRRRPPVGRFFLRMRSRHFGERAALVRPNSSLSSSGVIANDGKFVNGGKTQQLFMSFVLRINTASEEA